MFSSSISKFLQVFLRVVLFLGLVYFLFVSVTRENGEKSMVKMIGVTSRSPGKSKHHDRSEVMRMEEEKQRALSKFHINYMIKRRVPNGPDPIHNRRTGDSGHAPGQA